MIFHQNRLFVPELSGLAQHFNFFEGKATEVKLCRGGGAGCRISKRGLLEGVSSSQRNEIFFILSRNIIAYITFSGDFFMMKE